MLLCCARPLVVGPACFKNLEHQIRATLRPYQATLSVYSRLPAVLCHRAVSAHASNATSSSEKVTEDDKVPKAIAAKKRKPGKANPRSKLATRSELHAPGGVVDPSGIDLEGDDIPAEDPGTLGNAPLASRHQQIGGAQLLGRTQQYRRRRVTQSSSSDATAIPSAPDAQHPLAPSNAAAVPRRRLFGDVEDSESAGAPNDVEDQENDAGGLDEAEGLDEANDSIEAQAETAPAWQAASSSPPAADPPDLGSSTRRGRLYVLWDLDNKYPEVLDHRGLVDAMRSSLERFGEVVEMRAYCNYLTLNYVPLVWEEAMMRGMKHPLDVKKEPIRCLLCGKGFPDRDQLKKHFDIHTREHKKQFAHKPLAKKYVGSPKHQRYMEALNEANQKRRGYDLQTILKNLGVQVTPVDMGPQRADIALQKDAMKLLKDVKVPPPDDLTSPVPGLVMVSDDHGFEALIKLFASKGWRTITLSNSLFNSADEHVPWARLVTEEVAHKGGPYWRRGAPSPPAGPDWADEE